MTNQPRPGSETAPGYIVEVWCPDCYGVDPLGCWDGASITLPGHHNNRTSYPSREEAEEAAEQFVRGSILEYEVRAAQGREEEEGPMEYLEGDRGKDEKLYKVLGPERECCNGGEGIWRPPGEWMPAVEGELIPCENGYHLCRLEGLPHWIGPTIWEAEYEGEIVEDENKIVVRRARLVRRTPWDERAARHFSCDCAERALAKTGVEDERPWEAIAVARRYAEGEATEEELAEGRDAVWDCIAVWVGDGDLSKASALDAAKAVLWDAAGAAARAVARDAALAASRDEERTWQAERLREYLEGGAP